MNKGFTLVEVVITAAIIGVLSAMAVIVYSNYVKRSVITTALSDISSLKNDYELIFNENYSEVDQLNELSISKSDYCDITVTAPDPSTLVATKAITCLFRNDKFFGENAEIYLSRNSDGLYQCHVQNIEVKFIPKTCV